MTSQAVLDFELLLKPLSGESPTGENLHSDDADNAAFRELKSLRKELTTAEREIQRNPGEAATETVSADWRRLRELATGLLTTTSKDLWVAAWLLEALVRLEGFAGCRDGYRLIRELAERYWDGLSPPADAGGRYLERVMQLTRLNGQGSEGALLAPLRLVPLFPGGEAGHYTLNDYIMNYTELGRSRGKAQETGKAAMQAAADNAQARLRTLYGDLQQCLEEYRRFEEVLLERAGDDAPPTGNVFELLESCSHGLRVMSPALRGEGAEPAAGAAEGAIDATAEPAPAATPAVPATTLSNREEAFRTLERVADFFRRTEPHSPISYLLEQAVRWGHLSLPELMQELIGDGKARSAYFQLTGIRGGAEEKKDKE